MGCGCSKATPVTQSRPDPEPRVGDWEAEYPSGDVKVFTGRHARTSAVRAALASGGTYRRVERVPRKRK